MGQSKELFIQMRGAVLETVQSYDNGDTNILDACIEMKKLQHEAEEMVSTCKAFFRDNIDGIQAASEAVGKTYKGYSFQVNAGRKSWNYSAIPEIVEASNKVKELQGKYQAYFNVKFKGGVPLSEDGEVMPLPTLSYGSSSVTIKEKK